MGIEELVEIVNKGGVLPILILILVAGMRKWWVFGWYVQEVLQDRNEWKEAALHGTRVASRAVDLAAGKDPHGSPES